MITTQPVLRACFPDDRAFGALVAELDAFLAVTDGDEHAFYSQFNHADTLDFALVAERAGEPLGCGALRAKTRQRVEIKRMFVCEHARGEGIAQLLLRGLEDEARARGYAEAVLETGVRQVAAVRLYERAGYTRIAPYPPYAEVTNSVCFGKSLS